MSKKIYKENQRVKDPILLTVLGALLTYSFYILLSQLFFSGTPNLVIVILSSVAVVLLGVSFWAALQIKLKTQITSRGIVFKMSPLHQKKHEIKWDEIESCQIISSPKVSHMHGGNMKFWFEKKFTLNGRNGVSVTTTKGSHYFIGSQDPESLESAIKKAIRKIGE